MRYLHPIDIKPILWLFALSCCFHFSIAQEILNPPPQAKFITRFSFRQLLGGIMIVRAKLGNMTDSLDFILDTGCGGISLDSTTCASNNIRTMPSDTTMNAIGGVHKVDYVFDQTLHFPGLTLDRLNFHVSNYSLLSSVYGERIDGIIGYSFFEQFVVKINFDRLVIEVYSKGKMESVKGGATLRPFIDRIPIQALTIRERQKTDFHFYFDTGAGLCFLMSEAFASDSNVLLKNRKPVFVQAEGMGGKMQMKLTVIKSLQIGKYKFKNVPTYLFDDFSNVTAYPAGGGLVGNDLLRRFNLIINYSEKEIHISPNSHFSEPFDYSYTGLGIYSEAGVIYIEDIMPGSPGEKAGLKIGDILMGVETNFSGNIIEYKTLLQSANKRVVLFIKRNGKLIELNIKPRSIF
jgi:hypothetical protein